MRGDIRPPRGRPVRRAVRVPRRPAPPLRASQSRLARANLIRRSSVFSSPRFWLGGATVLVALAVVGANAQENVARTRTDVSSSVTVAQESLQAAQARLTAMDIAGAEREFGAAESALQDANQSLVGTGLIGGVAAGQASGDIRTAQQLLATAEQTAQTGRELAVEIRRAGEETAKSDQGFFRTGEIMRAYLPRVNDKLAELDRQLRALQYLGDRASQSANPELAAAAAAFDGVLPKARTALDQAREVTSALPDFLGEDQFKRYILLFQNPAELRATGGFTGTFGQLTMDQGTIKELKIESIYNPANQAKEAHKEPPPEPIVRSGGDGNPWLMQDANWNPDFPTSAQKYQFFYEKADGPSTDGVIAITASPIIEILRTVGPIEQPEIGQTLTADSFYESVANYQQTNATAGNDPKALLRDFMPRLLEKIRQAPSEQQQRVRQIMAESIKAKDIQLYFNDDRLEAFVTRAGLGGQLRPSAGQLAVVDSNLSANKSSADVSAIVGRKVTIGADGTVTGQLTLTRSHSGSTSQEINGNHTRLYFPRGTAIDSNEGWAEYEAPHVSTEGEYTIVAGWTDVAPGEQRTVAVSYQLPDKVDLRAGKFPLSFWRQAGSNEALITEATLPEGYVWNGIAGATVTGNVIRFEEPVRSDIVHQLTFKKQ